MKRLYGRRWAAVGAIAETHAKAEADSRIGARQYLPLLRPCRPIVGAVAGRLCDLQRLWVQYHASMMDVAPLQPRVFALGEEIHIWSVQLRGSDEHVARCSVAASVQESQRAEQFRFQHLRRAFLLAHGSARALLAQYLGISGAEIEFKYKPRGKPLYRVAAHEPVLQSIPFWRDGRLRVRRRM